MGGSGRSGGSSGAFYFYFLLHILFKKTHIY